jgi:glutathione S-transferase
VLLYDSAISGNCYKVRLLFSLLGIEYERREVDVIDRSGRGELLGDLNPGLRVPTLVLDDGRPLAESDAILLYFAEGTEYLPEERYARAQVLQWMFFEQYSHEPNIAVLRFWAHAGIKPSPREALAKLNGGQAALEAMERHLAGHDFFVGEARPSPTSPSTPTPTSPARAASRWAASPRSAPGWSGSRRSRATSRSTPDRMIPVFADLFPGAPLRGAGRALIWLLRPGEAGAPQKPCGGPPQRRRNRASEREGYACGRRRASPRSHFRAPPPADPAVAAAKGPGGYPILGRPIRNPEMWDCRSGVMGIPGAT